MKVGIITFHFVNNYGAVLQAYALQKYIKDELKVDSYIIDYVNPFIKLTDALRLLPISSNIREITSGICSFKDRISRMQKLAGFINRNTILTKEYHNSFSLKIDPPSFDKYICGSDQIWNPFITFGICKAYYLSFVNVSAKKIAYAPSFGTYKYSFIIRQLCKKHIMSIANISSREKEGVELISLITGKECPQLIDPTLLLTKEQWHHIAKKPESIISDYILVYIVQRHDESIDEEIKQIKQRLNLSVVEISRYSYARCGVVDSCLVNIGPEEYIGLFENAKYIVTDSHHGLIFSFIFDHPCHLIYGKQFPTRIMNMLNLLGIKTLYTDLIGSSIEVFANQETAKSNIGKEIEKSKDYLCKAILG